MRTIQRYLSDFLNLFFPEADEPDQLWSWWGIAGMAALTLVMVLLVIWS